MGGTGSTSQHGVTIHEGGPAGQDAYGEVPWSPRQCRLRGRGHGGSDGCGAGSPGAEGQGLWGLQGLRGTGCEGSDSFGAGGSGSHPEPRRITGGLCGQALQEVELAVNARGRSLTKQRSLAGQHGRGGVSLGAPGRASWAGNSHGPKGMTGRRGGGGEMLA